MEKVKEVQTNIAIYSHALLRIHVIGGRWSIQSKRQQVILQTGFFLEM